MAYDSNWWFGPNSMFAHIMDDTKYGREGVETDRTFADWLRDQFEGTGVTATVGVAPDTEIVDQLKQYLPFIIIGYLIFKT